MKALRSLTVLLAVGALSMSSVGCGDDDNQSTPDGGTTNDGGNGGDGGGNDGGGNDGGPDGEVPACDLSVEGRERDQIPYPNTGTITLTSDKVWELEGITHVADGEVLTIEPCTVIVGMPESATRGVAVLVVSRGGQIQAAGEADRPILFTSSAPPGQREAGDWGGVVILGRAPTNAGDQVVIEGLPDAEENRFGGNMPADNSGVFRYVRIEFNGYELVENVEVNGLTMGGVGSGTQIDHVMVNNNIDDCFEWFGGTVSATHLICNNGEDDQFDGDLGWNGSVEYFFGRVQNASSSDPHGFEIDGNRNNFAATPLTNPQFSKGTLCGPGVIPGTATRGAVLRRGARGSLDEVVLMGFQNAMSLRDDAHGTPEEPAWTLSNMLVFAYTDFNDASGSAAANDELAFFNAGTNNMAAETGPFTLADCQADDGPTAAVTGSNRGAFVDGNWMTGLWVDWSEN